MKKKTKGRYNFLIEEKVYVEFSRICEEEGLVRSKQVEKSMKRLIKEYKNKSQ